MTRRKRRRSRKRETTVPKETASDVQRLEAVHPHRYDPFAECLICRNQHPFDLPERVVEACLKRELVVFAGAGVSTEAPVVLPWTLYSDSAAEVGIGPAEGVPFPTVMSRFEDARGRPALLQLVKRRFDAIDAFPDLKVMATRFHRELGTLFYVQDILTTNWDTYFESECGAIPIVNEADYAFWNFAGRKVFKVHGSMNNIGSIVATEDDYAECYAHLREGVTGGSLKHLLATKTILFVGYSFRDEDFNQVYSLVQEQLGKMLPRPLIVTLDSSLQAERSEGADVILTDATFFLTELKAALRERTDCLLDDERFDGVGEAMMLTKREHARLFDRFSFKEQPLVIYAAMYQDGLDDAFERMMNLRGAGVYSHCDVVDYIEKYEGMRTDYLERGNYLDAAYTEGYIAAMEFLLADDGQRGSMPLYYVFGSEESIRTVDAFAGIVDDRGPTLDAVAYRLAAQLAEGAADGIVPHHRATLSPP